MRRHTDLTVDTVVDSSYSGSDKYEIAQPPTINPRRSVESEVSTLHPVKPAADIEQQQQPQEEQHNVQLPQAQPSIRLLFSLVPRRDCYSFLLPAVVTSVIAGGVAPFMTLVVGQTFDAFANFPITGSSITSEDRSQLKQSVGLAALELVALAAGSLALSSVTSALWISTGERNVMRLRRKVYDSVTNREMSWFDLKMGSEDAVVSSNGEDGPVGPGGMMAKFARETDDVRMASSLASGTLIQYLTTCIASLALAFSRSWALTLVILSAVPLLIFIQSLSQRFAGPLVGAERIQMARAASLATRALTAITTVKAFNAQAFELSALTSILQQGEGLATRMNAVWGATSALSQTTTMAMFVQGFWFGASLVRKGKASPGDVMAVFWACLIATSNLQMCIPQLITLTKGKFAMAALISLIDSPTPAPPPPPQSPPPSPSSSDSTRKAFSIISGASNHTHSSSFQLKNLNSKAIPLRKIRPPRCTGELALHNVHFAYPSRCDVSVLQDVSLYFPSRETTFVVGGSGSGKSTVAQLLACLYSPQLGQVTVDEQDLRFLDDSWVRKHVAVVSQTCVLFEGTVHENVCMGVSGSLVRRPEDVKREEVVDICTRALLHEFIRDLPNGYETRLGAGGANLSGGQKQRLAIARALLRDPTVLVLDEATSALDATSRVLVFEAIRAWRRDKTTIVITHDLSQIGKDDFVYVLKDGQVVEQGFRLDLEAQPIPLDGNDSMVEDGEFRKMMHVQGEAGGFPVKDFDSEDDRDIQIEIPDVQNDGIDDDVLVGGGARLKHQSVGVNGWMLDVVQDLTRSRAPTPSFLLSPTATVKSQTMLGAKHLSHNLTAAEPGTTSRKEKRLTFESGALAVDRRNSTWRKTLKHKTLKHAASLQFVPSSPPPPLPVQDDGEFEEKSAMERTGAEASKRRLGRPNIERMRWTDVSLDDVKVDSPSDASTSSSPSSSNTSLFSLFRTIYPTVPSKPLILMGLIACVASGAMTPVFSFLLSKLLFQVSAGATDVRTINVLGGIVLTVAAADGLFMGMKFFLMETGAQRWVTALRKQSYERLLAQDVSFFDARSGTTLCTTENDGEKKSGSNDTTQSSNDHENSPIRLVQTLIKDGDDARNLIAVVLGQIVVVITMLSVGLIWALAQGWQLTLAGLAIGPVFAVTMAVQARLCATCERRNKTAREEIAKGYYDCIANVRAIRCMSLEGVFEEKFDDAVEKAYTTGIRGAFVEGATYGVASGLIYLAEALLFYVGAVLVAQGTYTYLQMVEVLNLVVFTVTIGSQLMQFTQRIAKATTATRDFNKILALSTDVNESHGTSKPEIDGPIEFTDVSFAYPGRSDVTVLDNTSLKIQPGECVAIVGASGSGKSTIAALLQRLYEPTSGLITIGSTDLSTIDVQHLRAHVAVVSQNPNLFDASVSQNIAYGSGGFEGQQISEEDVQRAARAANVHDFIIGLPRGYDTPVGDNAGLLSGGQAQRLAIARALARPQCKVLILDECTSALDGENQAAVMESLRRSGKGRTTVVVTHKLAVMQHCDRVVVVDNGEVAETGSFDELVRKGGVFARLARGGEWTGE